VVARAKVGGIEVALGFRKGEFVRHIDESRDIDTCHLKCRHVPTVVVDHGQALANMFDRFAFFGVVMQQTGSCALVAADDEVNEAGSALAWCPELDAAKAVYDGE
jgi:hypothetical protein